VEAGRAGKDDGGQRVEEEGDRFVLTYEMSNERVPKSTHDGQNESEVSPTYYFLYEVCRCLFVIVFILSFFPFYR